VTDGWADTCGRSPEHSAGSVLVSQGPRRNEGVLDCKSSEFSKSQPQVPLIEGDEIVQALPSNGPDQSFAEGICRWRLNMF
jgi:hypothetical protein